MTLQLRIAARMDVGMVRDHQEDDYAIASDVSTGHWGFNKNESLTPGPLGTLLLVADGMGGANAGEVASNTAVEGVRHFFTKIREVATPEEQVPTDIGEFLSDAILNAHQHILRKAEQVPETQGMGTTIVVVWILQQTAHVAWVGDSRCYLMNAKKGLLAISKDHSYVQQLIDKGELTEENAFLHPHRNVIMQSLGGTAQLPKPSYVKVSLEPGDRLLLCSDGLNTMLPDGSIQSILAQEINTDDCVRKLIQAANEAGGRDNITVVMADVVSDEPVNYPIAGALDEAAVPQPKSGTLPVNQQIEASAFEHQPIPAPPLKRPIWPILITLLALVGVIGLLYWANSTRLRPSSRKEAIVKPQEKDIENFADKVRQDSIKAVEKAKLDSLAAKGNNNTLTEAESAALEQLENASSNTTASPKEPLNRPGAYMLSYTYGKSRKDAQKRSASLAKKIGRNYTIKVLASINCGQSKGQQLDSCYEVVIRPFNSHMAADSFKKKNPDFSLFTPKRDRPNTN